MTDPRHEVSRRLCEAYLLGLNQGYLLASQMYILADPDLACCYEMGLAERRKNAMC